MTSGAVPEDFTRTVEESSAPAAERLRPRREQDLHEVGWAGVPPEEPATLERLMRDHVGHPKHHLRQTLGEV